MKRKSIFYCESAYAVGIIILAFATALMEKANFGMSMVVAPAYLIHLKVSQYFPFYTLGMSTYIFEAVLLALLSIVMRKIKISYLLSFVTAIVYGIILDFMLILVAPLPSDGFMWRFIFYCIGMLACSTGIAMLFHTYLPPEAYEMVVKEFSHKFAAPISKVKTIYDCYSCAAGIVLSFVFFGFGNFVGVKWGTILCALLNGWLIGRISHYLDAKFEFRDAFPLRGKLN